MKYSILYSTVIAALSLSTAQAATITGKVVDKNNHPINAASIHIHGKDKAVYSNENGEFTIVIDNDGQLHISKDDYIDERVTVTATQTAVDVTLAKSSIETVTVFASGLHKTNMDMASPVTVLAGDELKNNAQATLGETLKGLPGVNATYFGPVSSSPIIRGLDGPRVKVLQNGLDSSDASRIGADHATTNESLTAQQIEVLRGPATLLYGSGAIGGVVNVVDQRIPTDQLNQLEGAVEIKYDSVSNGKTAAFNLAGGDQGFNLNINGLKRQSDDYKIPEMHLDDHDEHADDADHAHETTKKIDNTFIDSTVIDIGASYVSEHLTLGLSYGNVNTEYGIPGHDHAHDHEHEDGHEHQVAIAETVDEHSVYALLEQDRWQALAVWTPHNNIVEKVEARIGYTQYQHAEIEDGQIGTTFKNDSQEARFSVEHTLGQWHGVVGYHYYFSDYQALGEEAFTPSTETRQHGLFLLEERNFDGITLELGARVEKYELDSSDIDTGHSHDDVDHHEASSYLESFNNISLSTGLVWNIGSGYSTSINVTHSERAPSAAELLSNGLHISTGTYDLGLGYVIEDGEVHFEPENIKQETANNLDISFRKYSDNLGFTVNFYYNRVNNFYFQQATDYVFDQHDHELIHVAMADEDSAPVYQFTSQDATLYGVEFDLHYSLTDELSVKLFGDNSRITLEDDNYLPRVPANKLGGTINWQIADFDISTTATHYFAQNKIAFNETSTAGYTLLDAAVSYQFNLASVDSSVYLKANNLTNELAFVHSSFIKEIAPLPGRNIAIGIRAFF